MAKRQREKTVATLRHEEASRKNIPTAEFRSVMERAEQSPVQVAYERRNRDLDPQFVWRGKDAQDWSDLVVQAPPLFIQEKVHPKVLIDDLCRQRRNGQAGQGGDGSEVQPDLFADFNGLPSDDARTEFYQHDANWSNRMILGDSLQVMASLAEREGLRGKVQCIYLDPPYPALFLRLSNRSRVGSDRRTRAACGVELDPALPLQSLQVVGDCRPRDELEAAREFGAGRRHAPLPDHPARLAHVPPGWIQEPVPTAGFAGTPYDRACAHIASAPPRSVSSAPSSSLSASTPPTASRRSVRCMRRRRGAA